MFNLQDLLASGPTKVRQPWDRDNAPFGWDMPDTSYGQMEDQTPEITVTGAPPYDPNKDYIPPQYTMGEYTPPPTPVNQTAPDTSNMPRMEASPQEVARTKLLSGLPEHKGMFGLKGTLRDILGTVGDVVLTATGGNPIYAPARKREMLSDARIGYDSQNPDDVRAAIGRVTAIDPEAGMKLIEHDTVRNRYRDMAQEQQAAAEEAAQKARALDLSKGRELAMNVMNMVRQRKDLSLLPSALSRIQLMTGLAPEQLGLSPDMSLDDVGLYAYGGIKGAQQENIDLGRDRLTQQATLAREAEAGRMARDNPPPAPKQPTIVQSWVGDDGYKRTQLSDGNVVKSTTKVQPTGKGAGRFDSVKNPQAPASGGKYSPGQILYRSDGKYKVNPDGKTATKIK